MSIFSYRRKPVSDAMVPDERSIACSDVLIFRVRQGRHSLSDNLLSSGPAPEVIRQTQATEAPLAPWTELPSSQEASACSVAWA